MQTSKLLLPAIVCLLAGATAAGAQANLETVRSLVNKGNTLMRSHHFQEAIDTYEDALKVDPGNPIAKSNITEAHNNWGIFYFQQHKYRQAKAEWDKCLELTPNHANAKRNIAILNKVCAQQGISLEEPPPQEGTVPATAGKTPEKTNPPSAPASTGTAETPKAAPEQPSAGAVILTPGIRAGEDMFSGGTASEAPVNNPAVVSPPSTPPVSVRAPANNAGSGSWQNSKVSPLFPNTPDQFTSIFTTKAQNAGSAAPAQPPPAMVAPVPPHPVQPPGPPAASTVEDQLAAVEMKVYGQRQSGLTILQRLDKMERDTAGTTSGGTIMERIGKLRQTFGL